MSGRSSSAPSGNHFASLSMNVRGISHGPRCEPATNSSVAVRETGSTGSHTEHVCVAVDVVVRLILVPGRALRRARLLHEHVVVVEAHPLGAHQPAGDRRCGRGPRRRAPAPRSRCQLQKSSKKRPGIVRPARDESARARVGEVLLDRRLDEREIVLGERSADADGAVAPDTPRRGPGATTGGTSIARVYVDGRRVDGSADRVAE